MSREEYIGVQNSLGAAQSRGLLQGSGPMPPEDREGLSWEVITQRMSMVVSMVSNLNALVNGIEGVGMGASPIALVGPNLKARQEKLKEDIYNQLGYMEDVLTGVSYTISQEMK